jgi:hypothetical protein
MCARQHPYIHPLVHLISKMHPAQDGGSRFGIVVNGSPLCTGGAGSGESENHRYVLENDLVGAIIGLPDAQQSGQKRRAPAIVAGCRRICVFSHPSSWPLPSPATRRSWCARTGKQACHQPKAE